ncbi:lysophospholipid acyltransferase family protein [Ilumatobacter nonamiensis]|uniref:lysophospholipid acyltransferase family protein n=1 Tax=Ilumatobacter nonamiensis TaxID=467093 RepID=UPI000344E077|nr:lysophospholipid acyltransferase family protein [Ilumatobacter nonamiensis]
MGGSASFSFELAPELPGADRFSKYLTAAFRTMATKLWDFTVEGRENIPLEGPGIITPNHLSFCDSVFVPSALPRRVWAIGKGEYMDSWKTKHIFPAMGMIPVDRTGGDAAKAALDTAAKVLDQGHLFMIYPEGTRSRSGDLHKGRTGAARLAIRCNAPIIPTGHVGTVEVQPPDSVVMKPRKAVTVRFGAPMWAHEFGDPEDPRTLRRFTDAVMFEIAELSGQKYVDTYAGKKTETPDEPTPAPEQTSVTPRRPSVVGAHGGVGTRPTRPSMRASASSDDDETTVGVPRGRKVPATAGNAASDS